MQQIVVVFQVFQEAIVLIITGTFMKIEETASWWGASEYDNSLAYWAYLNYNFEDFNTQYNGKNFGFSVRCIKNES